MTPEQVVAKLLSGTRKEQREVISIIQSFSSPECEWPLKDKLEVLRNCSTAPHDLILEIVKFNLFSPDPKVRESCIELTQKNLSRPGRSAVLESLLKGETKDLVLALSLAKEWGARAYGEQIDILLEYENPDIVCKTIETLGHISLSTWESAFHKIFSRATDRVRQTIATQLGQQKLHLVSKDFIESMLEDTISSVRIMGLRSIANQLEPRWIKVLDRFIKENTGKEERIDAIKMLGQTQHSDAIMPLVHLLSSSDDQSERWTILQALDRIDQKSRLNIYEKLIEDPKEEQLPIILELVGSCEGEPAYRILKKALDQFKEPYIRSLIAGAMGTTDYPPCEKDLLELLNGDVSEAYAAASALKNIMKGRVMHHFENYLRKEDLDLTIKQILIQHITESAHSLKVSESLIQLIETYLQHENENLRYLAILALGAIAEPKSLKALIEIEQQDWTELFKSEVHEAIERCCKGKITPLLHLIMEADSNDRITLQKITSRHPLSLTDEDLDLLSGEVVFNDWAWDTELLSCVEKTHRHDPSFVWRQFSRESLSDRLCCFLARGFDEASPNAHEIIEPRILINCFNRFHTEKPLLLLGKLMSNFPRTELLPPLIQYSESSEPETEMIFKSYVRKIIMGMSKY